MMDQDPFDFDVDETQALISFRPLSHSARP